MNGVKQYQGFLAAVLLGLTLVAPVHAGETFRTLKGNIFLCVSPQVYDDAMVRVRELNGGNLEPLKKELSEKQQCMFADPELVGKIMAPFAVVLQRDGTKVQVQFIVTFRENIAFLHRMINRFVLVGWTDEANLEPKQVL